jgi:signal transduction histidine kinase
MPALPALLRLAPATGASLLAGCIDGAPGAGTLWPLALLLLGLLGAGLAYAVGRLRAGQLLATQIASAQGAAAAAEDALRLLREELRRAQALQSGWSWHTDSEHRLLRWDAPAGAAALPDAALPALTAAELHGRLHTLRAFGTLRLPAADASGGWLLRGEPRFDARGHFDGYSGVAEPSTLADRCDGAEQAVQHLLAAHPQPLLLAVAAAGHEGRWRLAQANPAAQTRWPGLQPGQALSAWFAQLSSEGTDSGPGKAPSAGTLLAEQLLTLAPGAAVESAGWRLQRFDTLADGSSRLLLSPLASPQPLAVPAEPRPEALAADGEGENFSFTLSHDLRAPIRVVEGFTRIVKEDYGRLLDRVGNDHLDRVLGAAARMNLMIDALLTLARLSSQPLAHQPVNLTQLASFVMDDLRRHSPERAAEVEIEPGLSAIGDPTLLRLVLENLLGNAWKYSARCSHTRIRFGRETNGGRAAFVVRDNGAGFDMRSADRLFGLFQRLHSANDFPGTGVGLASVRRIVRRHGGDIWAEAEPGRGATFHFTLA